MMRALSKVQLQTAIGFDRDSMAMSTVIDSPEWKMDTLYENGRIGDVNIYHNANANKPGVAPTWKWYGGIPTANIKAYRFVSGDEPVQSLRPVEATTYAESQDATQTALAPNAEAPPATSGSSGKR
jgi:hypothetical protein